MEPRLHLPSICLALTFLAYAFATPIGDIQQRSRRDLCGEGDDRCLEDNYWNEVLPLGFFINSNAAAGGVADAPATKRGLSNKPGPLSPGSGSGSHVIQRSDIPGQKAQDAHASEQTVQASPAVVKSEPSPPAPPPALAGPPGPTATEDSTKHKTVFCQGEKEWLQCPMYRVIKVNKAFWGRQDQTTCVDKSVTRTLKSDKLCAQDEANTMKKVETMCNDENACELVASETFFDRADCPDVYKYVQMEYECLHSETRIKEANAVKSS
eukprot:Seg2082.4 transcript_id=Seg2082.4/GoldUCD/mRNA.D3Y31 product="Protein eva-1 C" protein_id=Seg2082.4/GoldUCD/D3Y31